LKLLFIGESPPASGRFFYQRDSGLYRAMRDTFRLIDASIGDDNFLTVFQASGCYLIDLCRKPVDDLDAKSRRAICQASEELLSRAIAELQPPMIATLLRSIEANVVRAASRAAWTGPFVQLPYPGRWSRHRALFQETIVPTIRALMVDSLAPDR
jgi:hypothetical protein